MKPKPFVHRAFATVLAATMLCSLTPAAAFGAEEDVADASGATEAPEGPVAQVGDKSYDTLLEAINAAGEGDTIKLLRDFSVPEKAYTEYNLPKNSTLDLNKQTLIVPKLSAVFQGENATIENGKIDSSADYSIWIGNGSKPTSITVRNVEANAGINVYAASATLIDCTLDASSKDFYAIWADNGYAEITVESGTYIGGSVATVNATSGINYNCYMDENKIEHQEVSVIAPGKIFIKGGTFTGEITVKRDKVITKPTPLEEDVFSSGEVYISGGTFNTDVEEFLTDDVKCYHGGNGTWTAAVDHAPRTSGAVPATCTSAGSTGTTSCSACGHLISAASVVPALGHAWEDSPTVDVPPTCTEDGSESVHCARCGETKDAAALPALGHNFGEGVTTTEPTATQDGVLTFTCAVCGATRTEPIPATGPAPHEHDFAGALWERDAHAHWRTCTVPGCNVASAKEPHAFGGWTTEKEPTTAEEGAQARACGVCGFTEREAIPALEPDANGWIEDADGTWQLVDEDGGLVEEGWQEVGGDWYYFEGSAMQTGWEQVNGEWYYLEESGAMATGWQEVDGTWYYLNNKDEGTEGSMATGWKAVDKKWYYLKQSGAMATGWQKVGGAWYYLSGAGEGVEGSMATGWKKDGATWYYLAEKGEGTEGAMATGWRLVDGAWYRFEGSGAMLSGWQKVGRAWYLLNATHDGTFGRMLEGWQRVDGRTGAPTSANSWYYLRPGSGAMAANTRVGGYYVGPDGRWRPGR